jgi:glycosyltransferase involved in cell wall biosynthesis
MKIVVCHSDHAHCGIAEYGRQLDEAMRGLGADVESRTFSNMSEAKPGAGSTILVHFEPALVPAGFLTTLADARARGAHVVLCCHHYAPTHFSPIAMRLVDRFVLHRKYDGIGAHPKFVEIPLGCPIYEINEPHRALRQRYGLPLDKTIVTTLGFLTSWKRIPEVLPAMIQRFTTRTDVFLQILTPHPFNKQDDSEEVAVREALKQFDPHWLAENVLFSTEFRSERELLDRVFASDLGFLFYGQHTGSVSAATKQFVSGRCPLVATSSSHASDLRAGVDHVRGFDLDAFTAAVSRVVDDGDRRIAMREGMQREYDRINMAAVAQRYLDLFGSLA